MNYAAADPATTRNAQLQALLARCRLGDRAAFARLYDHTSGLLFGIVLRINRDRASAEDVLQEVYVKVWRSAQSYDATQAQPLTWLTSIARNAAIDSLRRRQTQPQLVSATIDDDDDPDRNAVDSRADDAPAYFTIFIIGTLATTQVTNSNPPTGGVIIPIVRLTMTMMPNCRSLMPSAWAKCLAAEKPLLSLSSLRRLAKRSRWLTWHPCKAARRTYERVHHHI